ncbi:MAG TPA: class I SAM-dependent rRNA methyltransferase [Candidatus Angelobacter sp.]|nr:class I SAM-dependent rRNA methyltransferase [Candidatus Angelobacter sp.]
MAGISSPTLTRVGVNSRAVGRLRAGHVWVYESDIVGKEQAQPGSLVHIVDQREKALGTAFYSNSSQIALRLLTPELLNSEEELHQLLSRRIAEAIAYRKVGKSDAYRLIFSEADRLPGLIVDRFNDVYTLQVLTQAWDKPERKNLVAQSLRELTRAAHIVERVDERIRGLEQLPTLFPGLLYGSKSATVFTMNGVRFHYDALGGQKTGAFLDQRENYAAAMGYAHGDALDVCTYQGGFALHLAKVCNTITAIDISREALEVAEQNEKLNRNSNRTEIEWMEANAFDLLKDYAAAGRQYDTIILDPPAFARTKKNLESAIRGYKELNLRAMKMLRPGGILVSCSCSFHVSEGDFLEVLASAARDTYRFVRVLEKRTQAKDHPILLGVPETFYLKCIICAVD